MHITVPRSVTFYAELINRYEKGSRLSGVIYIHRISGGQFGGISGRNFDAFCKLCGDAALKNVVLVTNMWEGVPPDVGEAREYELFSKHFKPALHKGARMVQHRNTVQSAHDIIQMIVANTPVVLQIQRELIDERKDIVGTMAGEAINRELDEQGRRHQVELREVREEMMRALKEKDEQTRRELEEETRRLHERMEEIAKDSERVAADYAAEKERMEVRMAELEQKVRQGERDEADDTHRLQDETNVPVTDWTRPERQMKRLQNLTDTPATIPADEPAHHDTLSHITKGVLAAHSKQSLPPISPRQTPYVRVFYAWLLTMIDVLE